MVRSDGWTLADLVGAGDPLRDCCVAAVHTCLPTHVCSEFEQLPACDWSPQLLDLFPDDVTLSIKPHLHKMLNELVGQRPAPTRLAEFVSGRCACRLAQQIATSTNSLALTSNGSFVSRDQTGRPVWPDGIIGSITHSRQATQEVHTISAMAIIKPSHQLGTPSLGIDLESFASSAANPITHGLLAEQAEFDLFRSQLPIGNDILYRTALLSIKEAIYKALEPVDPDAGRQLEFRSACLHELDRSQHLPNRLLTEAWMSFGWACKMGIESPRWPTQVTGRCLLSPTFVLSICQL